MTAKSISKKVTGLVLTGGGARAAYQVGVLCALSEILPRGQNPFQVLAGTSAGAINIAHLASHGYSDEGGFSRTTGDLRALWHSLTLESIYRTDGFSLSAIAAGWISRTLLGGKGGTKKVANYLLDTGPLRELLLKTVDFEAIPKAIEDGRLKGVSITATHYFEGLSVSFYCAGPEVRDWIRSNRMGVRTSVMVDHILASSAIPIFFPPVVIDGISFGDGCLRQTTPLSPAIHLGAERLLCVGLRPRRKFATGSSSRELLIPPQTQSDATIAQIGGELMNAVFLDSLDSDVERLERINQSLQSFTEAAREKHFGDLRKVPILSLKPSRDLSEIVPKLLNRFPLFMRYLLRGIGASDDEGSSLLSYLAFEPQFIDPLIALGYEDTLSEKDAIQEFMGV